MGTALLHGKVLTPLTVIDDGLVWMEGGVIRAVDRASAWVDRQDVQVIDCTGHYVVPGFVDLHVHGGGGADVMAATPEAIRQVAAFHARGGTTAMLATTVSAPHADIHRVLDAVSALRELPTGGAAVIGANLEGPFISHSQRGAQNPGHVRAPSPGEADALVQRAGEFRVITMAPEVTGTLELARRMTSRGVVPSMGHSDADWYRVVEAVEHGYRLVTHLFCGMSRWVNVRGEKTAGVAESALILDELWVELIADGNHVSPHMMAWAIQAKSASRVCLVTDCISAAGMPPGEYLLGGVKVIVSPTAARMADGSGNAGSVATMDLLVRNVVNRVGVPLADAVRMASLTPSRLIGEDHRRGTLTPGKLADVVVLDRDLFVVRTFVRGEAVWVASTQSS